VEMAELIPNQAKGLAVVALDLMPQMLPMEQSVNAMCISIPSLVLPTGMRSYYHSWEGPVGPEDPDHPPPLVVVAGAQF